MPTTPTSSSNWPEAAAHRTLAVEIAPPRSAIPVKFIVFCSISRRRGLPYLSNSAYSAVYRAVERGLPYLSIEPIPQDMAPSRGACHSC
ncbi:hypothetical protein BDZ91DRAFT_226686 [Kalaharituber pfeilii]|nr:hypothetical protein BDZ91DRAFT_226686 [Kalaharituber pfeilii]